MVGKAANMSFKRRCLKLESPEPLLAGQAMKALLQFIHRELQESCRLVNTFITVSVSSPLVGNSSCPYMDVKCKTTNYITNLTRTRMTKETKSRQHCKNS